jgi:hypothetical protein
VRRPPALAAGVLLALAVALVATAAPARERPAELGRMAAEGAVTLSAAGGGHAILTASGLRPGQSVAGQVALANVGESRGRLALRRTAMTDTPGRFGGRLSEALLLRVEELGGGSWTGPLSGPDTLDLGVMDPGEGRSYKLTLTLPDRGPRGADNHVQGSSVTIDWAWTTEAEDPPVVVTPTPTPAASPAATPQPTATPEPPLPVRGAPRLELRIPHQRVLATRGISMFGSCDRPCRVSFRAQIRTAPLGGRGRTVQRGRVFRRLGAARRLPSTGTAERRLHLRLTPRAIRTLKRTMRVHGRVAVVVAAKVRGTGGTRTVTRRIVLKRAERRAREGGTAAP